jgi:thiosulfate reductase/polysulfide reductase chain A
MSEKTEIKKVHCFFCHWQCGVLLHVSEGRIVKIEPNKENPITQGDICLKGLAGIEFHYHPERLNYPLKRVGNRGEGKWKRVSWDEALDEIAYKLKEVRDKYGPETVNINYGTYRTEAYFMSRFLNLFGSPNIAHTGSICFCNTQAINNATYGTFAIPHTTSEGVRCMVSWGKNTSESRLPVWRNTLACKRKGAKLITIDPRYTEVAKMSDIWVRIRPCTDGALALGWLNVIIEERLYDQEFVEKWTVGFDQLRERVKEYTPERVADITWVSPDKIRESARMYATTKPAIIMSGVKTDQIGRNATQTTRAQCILRAITGNLDITGGERLGGTGDIRKVIPDEEMELNGKLSAEQRRKQLGTDRFKLFTYPGWEAMLEYQKRCPYVTVPSRASLTASHAPTLWRAILEDKPYPVRVLLVQANNPLLQATNSKLVYKALKKLDLLVVMDYFATPTAALADYVLPAADWMERPHLSTIQGSRHYITVGERAVQPEYERREDYQLWRGLGMRLGQEHFWTWETLEEAYDYRLEPLGYTHAEFIQRVGGFRVPLETKKYEKHGFATPSGKVEIYSTVLKELGYDPLPDYEEPAQSPISTPELYKEYPLILTTGGRVRYFYHSEFRQIKSMRNSHPDPVVEIHPDTAASLGITEGDWVWLESPLGRIQQKAKLDSNLDPRVVHAEHSWWFPEDGGEEPSLHGVWKSNINVLIDDKLDHCDDIVGSWPHMGLCKVYKGA